jgi:hypothetical protein
MSDLRYDVGELTWFATALFAQAGLAQDRALCMAQLLVEADLLGHTTHGLALAPGYLKEITNGTMTVKGDPEILNDFEATAVWDGKRLPGLWLTREAVLRHRLDRHPQQPSHRLPGRVPRRGRTPGTTGDGGLIGPGGAHGGAVRGCHAADDTRPARGGHPHRRRSDPDRHQRVHHHVRHGAAAA